MCAARSVLCSQVSRDDYHDVSREHKKLDKLFPIDAHWALAIILDDNAETWSNAGEPGARARNPSENLVHVDKCLPPPALLLPPPPHVPNRANATPPDVPSPRPKPYQRTPPPRCDRYCFWPDDFGETHNPVSANSGSDALPDAPGAQAPAAPKDAPLLEEEEDDDVIEVDAELDARAGAAHAPPDPAARAEALRAQMGAVFHADKCAPP